jgi:hypothetical protein
MQMTRQMRQQFQRRPIRPLQVVQKGDQRLLFGQIQQDIRELNKNISCLYPIFPANFWPS